MLLSVRKPLVSEWDVGLHPAPVSHASHAIQLYQVANELPIAFPHEQCLFTITVNGLWIVDVSNTGYHILYCGFYVVMLSWKSGTLCMLREQNICLCVQAIFVVVSFHCTVQFLKGLGVVKGS